ncbi:type II secretion system protein [Sporosarcina ureilytica]|uniref:type II secretion system protein n=1 Tax=Sporosarcina ureilytica TaxID=298596 RepID=UPI0009E5ECA9|nr:type II secretion system protein [Sporosarcina ureilytica]
MSKNTSRKKNDSQQGFTLIEMTFVLSIVILLTAIIMPLGNKWFQSAAEEDAIASIIATIYSLQSYSMAYNELTRLSFKSSGTQTMYIALVPGKRELSKRLLPEGMYVSDSSALKQVEFLGNGNIVQSGVLTIVGKTGKTAITFQFQRGRMIISESERVLLAGSNSHNNNTFRYIWYTFAGRHTYDRHHA